MSHLVISKILALLVNRLTADDKYSLYDRENLQQSISMQSSKKQKTLSNLSAFFFFWNLHQILNILKKKVYPHILRISQIKDCERLGYINV